MRLPGALARPLVFACLTAAAGAIALAGSAPVRLVGVSARSDGTGQTVLIEATDPVAYSIKRPDPLTVLVDLRNVSVAASAKQPSAVPEGPVQSVSVEELTEPDGNVVARVRMQLAVPVPHRVRSARNTIRVEFARPSAEAVAADAATGPAESPISAATPVSPRLATVLRDVSADPTPGGIAITLRGNGRLEASRVVEAQDLPPRLVLDFAGVDSVASAVTAGHGAPVQRVRVARNSQSPLVTRVVVDLERAAPYHLERAGATGEDLAVVFDASAAPAGPSVASAPPPSPSAIVASAAAVVDGGDPFSALAATPAAAPAAPAVPTAPPASRLQISQGPHAVAPQTPAPQQPAGRPAAQAPPESQRYSGKLVSLDFQDADLRAVLRTFAEISGLNMVIDPAVQGTVDVVLNEVPWDQALDIILRGGKLGYVLDGTVVRIAPLSVLADEEAARRKLSEAQALAGDLSVMTKSVSYSKASALKDLITKATLSTRGEVQVDERTNTLIIRDLRANLEAADKLIGDLDRPEPQVEIEARIVQTTRDFAHALGVQWGLSGRMQPDMGNTTSWAFPNRGILEGKVGTAAPNDPRSTALDATGTAVNLAVPSATSGIGLLLQSVNGAFNLDVALTALERSGKGRILSTPRVTTQNNQEAEMTQGVQIPVQTAANNTVTVTFKDAALTLKVTPQITSSDTVIMKVMLENAAPDYSKSVNNIPPIDTQRAITQVQVSDGATTVIGGIFVSNEQTSQDRVPLLYKIPLLGWLFKKDTTTDENRELLIFITPRILRG